jgi:hypothetical protein
MNGKGLLLGRVSFFQNYAASGRKVQIDIWGINLSTIRGDQGIAVGHTRRTYYFAGPRSNKKQDALSLPNPKDVRMRSVDPFGWTGVTPLAIRCKTYGVALACNANRVAATVGVHVSAAIRTDIHKPVLLWIAYDRATPANDIFHVQEMNP